VGKEVVGVEEGWEGGWRGVRGRARRGSGRREREMGGGRGRGGGGIVRPPMDAAAARTAYTDWCINADLAAESADRCGRRGARRAGARRDLGTKPKKRTLSLAFFNTKPMMMKGMPISRKVMITHFGVRMGCQACG
jgi:hypothetical protein